MLTEKKLYSYNDVTIIPAVISHINSRSECNPFLEDGKLPLFTAPMSSVVDEGNFALFEANRINAILPRNIDIKTRLKYSKEGKWAAYSLKEFEKYFCVETPAHDTWRALIDVANGHMETIYDLVAIAKSMNDMEVMVGNIANPQTMRDICETDVDYVRVGIGAGAGCITSSNTAIHYPMASLINECYKVREEIGGTTKIIADGGVRNYSDVIKALALGADYVMIGSLFAQCLESAGRKTYWDEFENCRIYINDDDIPKLKFHEDNHWHDGKLVANSPGSHQWPDLRVNFYGMASKDGQCDISGEKTKTSEGIVKSLPVLYTIKGWTENMIAYLRSAMSYCNVANVSMFYPYTVDTCIMSTEAKNSINK